MSIKSSKGLNDQVFLVSLLGFITSFFISFPLWFPHHNTFSPTPIFNFFEFIPELVHSLISILIISSLIFAFISKKHKKKFFLSFLFSFIVSLLLDQLRWQPWVYYYFFIFLSFLFVPSIKKAHQLNTIRIIIALIYLWSGIQKINFNFFITTYPWLIEPFTHVFSEDVKYIFNSTYLIAPVLEIVAALGLFFKKTNRISAFTLIMMHVFILSMIGPLGHNSNAVVWPWNIAFSILLYLLFLKTKTLSVFTLLKKRVYNYQVIIILLFGLMPALSFFDAWPMFFSSALYSGNKIESEVFIPDEFKKELPEYIKNNVQDINNSTRLNFFVQEELKVPIYPSKDFHLKAFKKLCNKYPEYSIEFVLINLSKPNPVSGEKIKTTYFCDEID